MAITPILFYPSFPNHSLWLYRSRYWREEYNSVQFIPEVHTLNGNDSSQEDDSWEAFLVTEQLTDLPDYTLTPSDGRLNRVYGDHPHSNDGKHLTAGIAKDPSYQCRWLPVMQLKTTTYSVPSGRWFVKKTLALLFQGV